MRGEQDEAAALSSLVWALGACKGMMQSRGGAVQLKATIHHRRTRQGRNSLIHRYTLFLPFALRPAILTGLLSPGGFSLCHVASLLSLSFTLDHSLLPHPLTLYSSLFPVHPRPGPRYLRSDAQMFRSLDARVPLASALGKEER